MTSAPIVHVIDDDPAARESLEFLLRSHDVETRSYESAKAFLTRLPEVKGGCVITDVRMPEVSGVELLHRLNEHRVELPVIVITGHGDLQLAVEAMKLGAVDFLEKPYEDDRLIAIVKGALEKWQKGLRQQIEKDQVEERLSTLTQREREVLHGLLMGKSNKVIAHDLDISSRTVEIYRANVMNKMNSASLSELVRICVVAGLIGGAPQK
jgi:two-component system response regulator FixJ